MDLSPEMIAAAKRKTQDTHITYGVADVLNLATPATPYDVLMSSLAQSYAKNTDELLQMCRQFYAQLKPGGRILTLNDHPDFLPGHEVEYRKYGKSKDRGPVPADGAEINVSWYCKDRNANVHEIPFNCYYYTRETLISVFEQAGFKDVMLNDCSVAPEGMAAFPEGYWDLLCANPLFCVITARKP